MSKSIFRKPAGNPMAAEQQKGTLTKELHAKLYAVLTNNPHVKTIYVAPVGGAYHFAAIPGFYPIPAHEILGTQPEAEPEKVTTDSANAEVDTASGGIQF